MYIGREPVTLQPYVLVRFTLAWDATPFRSLAERLETPVGTAVKHAHRDCVFL